MESWSVGCPRNLLSGRTSSREVAYYPIPGSHVTETSGTVSPFFAGTRVGRTKVDSLLFTPTPCLKGVNFKFKDKTEFSLKWSLKGFRSPRIGRDSRLRVFIS